MSLARELLNRWELQANEGDTEMKAIIKTVRAAISAIPLIDACSLQDAIRMLDERATPGSANLPVSAVGPGMGRLPGRGL